VTDSKTTEAALSYARAEGWKAGIEAAATYISGIAPDDEIFINVRGDTAASHGAILPLKTADLATAILALEEPRHE
jgi:hypothetical protein